MAESFRLFRRLGPGLLLLLVGGCTQDVPARDSAGPAVAATQTERRLEFHYRFRVSDLPAGESVRVWFPRPRTDEFQSVGRSSMLLPVRHRIDRDATHQNEIVFFEAEPTDEGTLDVAARYEILRRNAVLDEHGDTARRSDAANIAPYLKAAKMVPLDGPPLGLLPDLSAASAVSERARLIFDAVDRHMRYDKSQPGYGNGDVLWACRSGFGNCTDFHSLFLSLCRSQKIPARFEIGFPLPSQRGRGTIGGYHCWAYFFDAGRGWVPVDISEADKNPERQDDYFGRLDENRVAFTIGRDLTLEPQQDSGPLNYFIYPHVEVGGEVWPQDKIELTVEYEDL